MNYELGIRPSVPQKKARPATSSLPREFNARITLQGQTMTAQCLENDCRYCVTHSVETLKIGAAKGRELIAEHRRLHFGDGAKHDGRACIDIVVILDNAKAGHV